MNDILGPAGRSENSGPGCQNDKEQCEVAHVRLVQKTLRKAVQAVVPVQNRRDSGRA